MTLREEIEEEIESSVKEFLDNLDDDVAARLGEISIQPRGVQYAYFSDEGVEVTESFEFNPRNFFRWEGQ